MSKVPVIVLAMNLRSGYTREVHRSAAEYLRLHPQSFSLTLVEDPKRLDSIQPRPDGIIAMVDAPMVLRFVTRLKVPAVNISGRLEKMPLPTVKVDDVAVGRMAAEHLLSSGLRRFGYCGRVGAAIFVGRRQGFEHAIRLAGFECNVHLARGGPMPNQIGHPQFSRLIKWLSALEKPIGVFCGTDWEAVEVYEACRHLNLKIGQDIAVVGVDNDAHFCETVNPPLSSVDTKPDRIGVEAVMLLVRLIQGMPAPDKPILMQPVRVVHRPSSDLLAVTDPHVFKAVRFIRDFVNDSLTVSLVAKQVPLSRRVLERRFREHMGRSVLAEIHGTKIERIKQLLVATDQTIYEISVACGFAQLSHMAALFRKRTGLAPGAYRNQFRRGKMLH